MIMKSIIEEIFNGNRGTFENLKLSENHKKLLDGYCAAMEKLNQSLSDEQKEELNNIDGLLCRMLDDNTIEIYTEGFKIGLLVGLEVFGGV